MDIPFTAITRI